MGDVYRTGRSVRSDAAVRIFTYEKAVGRRKERLVFFIRVQNAFGSVLSRHFAEQFCFGGKSVDSGADQRACGS